MKKGFVFTLDSVLSFIIALQMFIVLNSMLMVSSQDSYFDVRTRFLGQDMLYLMEKEDIAENYFSMSEEDIESDIFLFLNNTLPSQYGAKLDIDLYTYMDPNFIVSKSVSVQTSEEKNNIVKIIRIVKPESGYGILRLSLWVD